MTVWFELRSFQNKEVKLKINSNCRGLNKIVMFRITDNENFKVVVIATLFCSRKYRDSEELTLNCRGQSTTL